MKIKYVFVLCILCMAIGGFVSNRYYKSEIVKVETRDVIKDRIVTHTITIKEPNGTETIDTTKTEDKSEDKHSKTVDIKNYIPQWKVDVQSNITATEYGMSIERRIMGPIFLGIYGRTNKDFGLSLGVEF